VVHHALSGAGPKPRRGDRSAGARGTAIPGNRERPEYNSSEGNCPDGGLADRIGYFRNFAALHTPESEGVNVADAASLVVADTEILLRPRP
jgi:hypothetical protein